MKLTLNRIVWLAIVEAEDLIVQVQAVHRVGLDAVLADNEHVEELVARMLLLAHVEEGSSLSLEPTALAMSVKGAIQDLESYAAVRHVALQTPRFESVTVNLSAGEIRMVATNLIVNAIQHSAADSSVSVSVCQDPTRAHAPLLEVKDHGEASRTEIFRSF